MTEDRLSARRRWLAFAVALVPFLLLVWHFDFICDDAFITFRYSRNLAEGQGLVYNPGVDPPVEGYSEFLWALLVAGGLKLGIAPTITARVLSIAAGVLLVFVTTGLLARRVAPSPLASGGAALFLGALAPLAVWSTGGMATMPFAAAVVALFALVWGREVPATFWKLGLVAMAVALLRADGAWWVAWILGTAIVIGSMRKQRPLWWPALLGAVISAAAFLAHLGWRLATYGDWLPNTARAKVGFSAAAMERGAEYVGHFLLTFPGVLLAILLGFAAWKRSEARILPIAIAALISFLYAILVGGDFMAFGRFLGPSLPFVALLLGAGLHRLEAGGRRWPGVALLVVSLAAVLPPAFGGAVTPLSWRSALSVRRNAGPARERSELDQWHLMNEQAKLWRDMGIALKHVSQPGESVVFGAIGAIGYYSELFVYDRNGLVTREVSMRPSPEELGSPGHDKTVPTEFFAKDRPTYAQILFYPGTMERLQADRRIGWGRPEVQVPPIDPAVHPRPGELFVVRRGDL